MVHHTPNLALVGCVACGELVEKGDLVHDAPHFSANCCTFHPYHAWCYRSAPPDPRSWTTCADCGAELAFQDVLAAARWLFGFNTRLHVGQLGDPQSPENAAPRPPALRFVRVRQPGSFLPRTVKVKPLFTGREREYHALLGANLELVHVSGCAGEAPIVARLRSVPGDVELRLVYADALEEAGDLERAAFVRDDVAKRRGEAPSRARRASFPSSWREAVARRTVATS